MASLLQQAQRDALRFAEADVDGNNELNFDEFLAMQPKKILEQYGEDDIREYCRVVSRVGGAGPRAGKRYRCSVYSTKKPNHAIPISRRISIYPSVFRKLHTRTRTACEQDRG